MGSALSNTFVWQRKADTIAEAETQIADVDIGDFVALPVELSDAAKRPTRATTSAAGFDLTAEKTVVLPVGGVWVAVGTGVKLAMDAPEVNSRLSPDTVLFGMVRARSGLTLLGVDAFHGTIDADYRGEIKVLLRNTTTKNVEIEAGDRIAQLVFSVAFVPHLVDYERIGEIFASDRGSSGFGSTGMRTANEVSVAGVVVEDQCKSLMACTKEGGTHVDCKSC